MLRNLNQSSGGRRILGVPQVGIDAATIASQTATGDNGPGLLYDDAINPANVGKQLRLVVTSPPSAGVFFAYENGSFDFSGAPDGSYSIGYNVLADKALIGSDTATVLFGPAQAQFAVTTDDLEFSGNAFVVGSLIEASFAASLDSVTFSGGADVDLGPMTITPADIQAIVVAVLAALNATTIPCNMVETNGEAIIGNGTEGNKFRSHLVG